MSNSVMRADYLKNSEPERVAQVRNTNTTTNLNATTSPTNVPLAGISDEMDTGFSIGTNGVVCNFTGRVYVEATITYSGFVVRGNLVASIAVAGTTQPTEGAGGYVRSATGHNEASVSVGQWVNVTTGQEVTVTTAREANFGTLTMLSGTSVLKLRRPAVVDAFPSNPVAVTLIWAEENSAIHSNVFDYSFGNGQSGSGLDGLPLHRSGKILSLSFRSRSGTSAAEIEVTLNGASTSPNANLVIPAGSNKNTVTYATPIAFSALDVFNFRTVVAGGHSNVVVCAEVIYDF